jgi:hypothetical protein
MLTSPYLEFESTELGINPGPSLTWSGAASIFGLVPTVNVADGLAKCSDGFSG